MGSYTGIIVAIIILIIHITAYNGIRKRILNNSINSVKHVYRTPLLNYAHFSKIAEYNKIIFPELALAKEYNFELNDGDALLIPKGWWHWVETTVPTIGVNFWNDSNLGDKPVVYPKYTTTMNWDQPDKGWLEILSDEKFSFWVEKEKGCQESTIREMMKKKSTSDVYIICLEAFETGKTNRSKISNLVGKYVKKPDATSEDPNFWVSLGYHDTGMHYDDKDGILVVLQGQKKVRMFSPSSSRLLHPYPETPDWGRRKTNTFTYANEIKIYSHNNHSASSQELYWCLYANCHASTVFTIIDKLVRTFGYDRVVWGIKRTTSGEMRLEFYLYYFNDTHKTYDILKDSALKEKDIQDTIAIIKPYRPKSTDVQGINSTSRIPNKEKLMIHSFNLYLDYPCVDNNIHLYYKKSNYNDRMTGYLGSGEYINSKGVFHEGLMYAGRYGKFQLDQAIKDTKCENDLIEDDIQVLTKLICNYPCQMIFFWAKNGYVLLQFCTISTKLYRDFLQEYGYPAEVVSFVNSTEDYNDTNISHEIGFSIKHGTGKVDRTATYGII